MSFIEEYNKTFLPENRNRRVMLGEAESLLGASLNPLPQNYGQLGKQLKDGARGLKNDFKQGASEHINGMSKDMKQRIENLDYKPLFIRSVWLQLLKRGHLLSPMLSDDAMKKLQEIEGSDTIPKSI